MAHLNAENMKIVALITFGLFVSPFLNAVYGYQDQPMGLTADGVALVASFEEQARKTLAHFDEEREAPKGRSFFVITKIYENAFFEQVYVQVESKMQEAYKGRIVSEPMGRVAFKKGAEITVQAKDVADWCIVMPNGEEEGNLTGKAMDALRAKVLVFVLSMKPENGTFAHFRVVSVNNPQTMQSVEDLVPRDVIAKVEGAARARWGMKRSDDEKEKFSPILVGFPEWNIIEK